jgi:hypothetical protein
LTGPLVESACAAAPPPRPPQPISAILSVSSLFRNAPGAMRRCAAAATRSSTLELSSAALDSLMKSRRDFGVLIFFLPSAASSAATARCGRHLPP